VQKAQSLEMLLKMFDCPLENASPNKFQFKIERRFLNCAIALRLILGSSYSACFVPVPVFLATSPPSSLTLVGSLLLIYSM